MWHLCINTSFHIEREIWYHSFRYIHIQLYGIYSMHKYNIYNADLVYCMYVSVCITYGWQYSHSDLFLYVWLIRYCRGQESLRRQKWGCCSNPDRHHGNYISPWNDTHWLADRQHLSFGQWWRRITWLLGRSDCNHFFYSSLSTRYGKSFFMTSQINTQMSIALNLVIILKVQTSIFFIL